MKQELTSNLKLVKGAKLFYDDNSIILKHYNTDIFKYDFESGKAEAFMDCSKTSNRQINYAKKKWNIPDKYITCKFCKPKWSFCSNA